MSASLSRLGWFTFRKRTQFSLLAGWSDLAKYLADDWICNQEGFSDVIVLGYTSLKTIQYNSTGRNFPLYSATNVQKLSA